jgi:adenylate cyclase
MKWKNLLLGLGVAVFFSLFYSLGVFNRLGNQVYDFFLFFRADRERNNEIVFLNVDDNAIAYYGVFPWPRSIIAEALLRLREFDAKVAIFDIEYIDRGPQGVDAIYLDWNLPVDFANSFNRINSDAADIFHAIREGWIARTDVDDAAREFHSLIGSERENLLSMARRVARDDDQYMIDASALFGRSWATLNLRSELLTNEEQQNRRYIAEERFAYPVMAEPNTNTGGFVDILPTLPGFALASAGSGFTNVVVDEDGVRRRVHLAQYIRGHWYLQLAFAPLVNYLGNPEIELNNRRLIMRNARMPDGNIRDITIPLDGAGRMLLDWPREDYFDSYEHMSFAAFANLERLEANLQNGSLAFGDMAIPFFAQFDSTLAWIPFIVNDLAELFSEIYPTKIAALNDHSQELFETYVALRAETRELIKEILDIDPGERVFDLVPYLIDVYPEIAGDIIFEAEIIAELTDQLRSSFYEYELALLEYGNSVRGKFVILGRSDTGTTDIGTNPFWAEYVNVGTHGVVIDMILSEVFITPIAALWRVLFALVFVFLFFIASAKFAPVLRAVSGFLIVLLAAGASLLLFRYTGIFFNPLLTALVMVIAVILREIVSYAGSEREKQFIRKAFSTYVSDEVVKEIIADPSRLQLGGTKRHMSAIFTDIKGFSTISEQLDPEGLVSLLNRYLTVMSDAILVEKGTIDKYVGDAIVAFFGAPVDLPDHALRACYSAVAMKRIERELNLKVVEEKLSPMPLITRVGINTGSMVAGNMGTGNKMNYTIMGNVVNLAARLEGVNKQYGTRILTADDTIRETGDKILTRKVDLVRVVGINEPVQLLEVINTMDMADQDEKNLVKIFHEALNYYNNRQWEEAIAGFKEAFEIEGDDSPSSIYLRRCGTFAKYPPPDTWDGVTNLTEK